MTCAIRADGAMMPDTAAFGRSGRYGFRVARMHGAFDRLRQHITIMNAVVHVHAAARIGYVCGIPHKENTTMVVTGRNPQRGAVQIPAFYLWQHLNL